MRSTAWKKEIAGLVSESWSVSWPITVMMLFEFCVGLVDVFIAGQVGKEAQAAYGFVMQLYFVFIIVVNALTTGAVSVVSRLFTAGDGKAFRDAVATSLLLACLAGSVLTVSGFILTPVVMDMINIPDQLRPHAVSLGRIYAAVLVFHYILIVTNGILRAVKKVRISLVTMTIVSAVNITFSFFLVFMTPVGFRGIAFASGAAVLVGSVINVSRILPLIPRPRSFSKSFGMRVFAIGWPSGAGQLSWQIHSMILFMILSALPVHRIEVLAAFSAGLRVESAIFLPALAFNFANAVIVGNLLGEGRKSEAFRAGIVTALMGVAVVTFLTGVVILGARWIMPLLSTNEIVVQEGVRYLYISMLSEPFMAFWLILGGALMGAGDTLAVMVTVSLSTWLVRIPLASFLVFILGAGSSSVWWSLNISQILTCCFIMHRYFRKKWLELD